MARSKFRRFLLPEWNRKFILRLLLVALATAVVFTQVLMPLHIEGRSMEPTYDDGSFIFCWRGQFLFSEPERGDVVVIRFSGRHVTLLKRVVGLAGDTVEFRNGALFVNNTWVKEPYVRMPSDWNMAARKVEQNKVFVVGDNRSVVMERHSYGQVERERIIGGVLW
jgi:signal peptidase I